MTDIERLKKNGTRLSLIHPQDKKLISDLVLKQYGCVEYLSSLDAQWYLADVKQPDDDRVYRIVSSYVDPTIVNDEFNQLRTHINVLYDRVKSLELDYLTKLESESMVVDTSPYATPSDVLTNNHRLSFSDMSEANQKLLQFTTKLLSNNIPKKQFKIQYLGDNGYNGSIFDSEKQNEWITIEDARPLWSGKDIYRIVFK